MRFLPVGVGDSEALATVKVLFAEYAGTLDFKLDFQNFESELAHLPGDYAAPDGCIILAAEDEKAAGCVALRKIDSATCEMKRLYVRPEFRGKGIGKELADKVIDAAREIGYAKMRLDTVGSMKEAISLYTRLGFKEIERYRVNPLPDAMFFELDLLGK